MADLTSAKATPSCPICLNRGPLTDEDILPSWARRQMLAEFPPSTKVAPARIKIRICQRCNERLGVQVEQPSSDVLKPLLAGDSALVGPSQHEIIARWVVKVSLLEAFASSRPTNWGYDNLRKILHRLVTTNEIPLAVVRLGTRSLVDQDDLSRTYIGDVLPIRQMPRTAYFAVSTHLRLMWELVVGADREMRNFARRTEGKRRWLQRIWPSPGCAVDLSRSEPMTFGQIEAMRRAFMASRNQQPNLAVPRRRNY